MASWRDPFDDLIADLEQSVPAAPSTTFDMPPVEDFCLFVESVLARDPAKRVSLAEDPRIKRVQAYYDRLARVLQASESVESPG